MHQPYWNCNRFWNDVLEQGFQDASHHLIQIENTDIEIRKKSALWLMSMDYALIYDVELEANVESNIGDYAKLTTHFDLVILDRPHLAVIVNSDISSSVLEFMYEHLGVTEIKFKTLEINKWIIGKHGRQYKST